MMISPEMPRSRAWHVVYTTIMAAPPGALRAAQVQSLLSLLNYNDPAYSHMASGAESDAPSSVPSWKVLVMDQTSTDILVTSMSVPVLRENGVTIFPCVATN